MLESPIKMSMGNVSPCPAGLGDFINVLKLREASIIRFPRASFPVTSLPPRNSSHATLAKHSIEMDWSYQQSVHLRLWKARRAGGIETPGALA